MTISKKRCTLSWRLRVAQVVDSPSGKIRGPERLTAEMRQQIDSAVPRTPLAKPKKPRKMLIVDLQMYSGHTSIPHGNWMLELMAKYTGAFEPTFSNDLSNLKYPKIGQYDAVYLNNVCGMIFPDPEVRESLLRFVREGGGIGGHHAVTFANLDWPEFMEMLGAWAGAHHTESQVLKIDDKSSPMTAMFGGQSFEHTDEFYHMPVGSPYSREKQHVLLSIDVPKSDMATGGPLLQRVHPARSGLRRQLDQDLRQGPRLLHTARPHRSLLHVASVGKTHARGDPVHSGRPQCR